MAQYCDSCGKEIPDKQIYIDVIVKPNNNALYKFETINSICLECAQYMFIGDVLK